MPPSESVSTPALANEFEIMPAKAIIPNPLPIRQSASRRFNGIPNLCGLMLDIPLVHKQKLARAQQYFRVPAPCSYRERRLFLLFRLSFARPTHAGHHPVFAEFL